MNKEQKDFVKKLYDMNLYPECKYSIMTEKFHWTSKLEVKQGIFLTSVVEHRDSPEEAIEAYREGLKGKYLIADFGDIRKEYLTI